MESNATGITKIAIEFVMVAIFLAIALRIVYLRDTYSEAFTKRQDTEVALDTSLEFGKYSGNKTKTDRLVTVTGDEVLAALRDYHRGEIAIYVDATKTGQIYQIPSTIAAHPEYFTVSALQASIDLTAYYYPYLVYDNEDPRTNYGNNGLEITGLAFIKK